jgi:hypothetical protein
MAGVLMPVEPALAVGRWESRGPLRVGAGGHRGGSGELLPAIGTGAGSLRQWAEGETEVIDVRLLNGVMVGVEVIKERGSGDVGALDRFDFDRSSVCRTGWPRLWRVPWPILGSGATASHRRAGPQPQGVVGQTDGCPGPGRRQRLAQDKASLGRASPTRR